MSVILGNFCIRPKNLGEKRKRWAEKTKENNTQELELWEYISKTEGAEVLDELSNSAHQWDDFIELLQIVDTVINYILEFKVWTPSSN